MQQWFVPLIRRATKRQIGTVLEAAVRRYNELYPEWEISVISLRQSGDPVQQAENVIRLLRSLQEQNAE